MQEIRIEKTTDEDFLTAIRQMIREELSEALPKKEKELRKYTRKETAEALHVSLVTLDSYTTQGLIEGERFGSRILYSRENIEKALQKLEGRKWKRK